MLIWLKGLLRFTYPFFCLSPLFRSCTFILHLSSPTNHLSLSCSSSSSISSLTSSATFFLASTASSMFPTNCSPLKLPSTFLLSVSSFSASPSFSHAFFGRYLWLIPSGLLLSLAFAPPSFVCQSSRVHRSRCLARLSLGPM
ncbi:hypothetical protein BGX38DRAFT_1167420 [Terfezia claveryi]|nr:hypothetical protein BGX38DRAFT_1167420 [Terfezia claveryi]